METTTDQVLPQSSKISEFVRATDLMDTFLQHADNIQVLSLDCFDTLLWRKTATPVDIFYDLQQRPAFKALGFTALMRYHGEANARKLKLIQHLNTEVTLDEIYTTTLPHLTTEQLAALAEDEVAAEIDACYAFPPVIELIRAAYKKNIKIIIVSDTYLKQEQLKRLLTHHLPQDVMAVIDTIFCSSEYGRSKPNGLFKHVLEKFNLSPSAFLHIGDNGAADFAAPRLHKLNAIHLAVHDGNILELFRMRAVAAGILDPSIRYSNALVNPFRGMFACSTFNTNDPKGIIGYASVGPIIYSFARYLRDEIKQLEQAGKKPKVLFLMRDAYLPSLVCNAITDQPLGTSVKISRFTAFSASFRNQQDVDLYISTVIATNRFDDIMHQLLIPKGIAKEILTTVNKSSSPIQTFLQQIHQKNILQIIFNQSRAHRIKLIRHLEAEIDLKPNDLLVFVDLGYSGTAQRQLEAAFRDEMNVEITGRYLIALGIPDWEKTRRGLLDPSWCDEKTMLTLVTYIALLEQICTSNDKSVMGYDEQGHPIYADSKITEAQYAKVEMIQEECVRFAKDAELFLKNTKLSLTLHDLRITVLAELGRLLFLPTKTEIDYFEKFQFEVNLGTKDIFNVFDQNQGLSSLRKRGLIFSFVEKSGKSMRMNPPAELRAAGLELVIGLMAHHRFGLEYGVNDLSLRREKINAVIIRGGEAAQTTIDASVTHDGYFSMLVPAGDASLQIGIMFGQHYQWIQFESLELLPVKALLTPMEPLYTEDYWPNAIFNDMVNKGGKLFECTSHSGLMMLVPSVKSDDQNYAYRIVFRPIVKWPSQMTT